MLDWLPLLLLTAAVMAAVVLLFGFTGCSLIVGGSSDEPEFNEVFEATLTEQRERRSRTIVLRIEPSKLFASGDRVRITLEPPATGELTIHSLYISQPAESGDPYDAADDLTPVQVGDIAVGGPEELEADYALDHTKPLLIAFETAESSELRFSNLPAGEVTAFVGPGPGATGPPLFEAAQNDRQSGYEVEDRIYLIRKIEVA